MCRENAALLELPRSESQTVLRHLHCSVRSTQVEKMLPYIRVTKQAESVMGIGGTGIKGGQRNGSCCYYRRRY